MLHNSIKKILKLKIVLMALSKFEAVNEPNDNWKIATFSMEFLSNAPQACSKKL